MLASANALGLVQAAFALAGTLRERMETARMRRPIAMVLQPVPMPDPLDFVRIHLSDDNAFGPQGLHPHVRTEYSDAIWVSEDGSHLVNIDADPARQSALIDTVIDIRREQWQGPAEISRHRYEVYALKSWTAPGAERRERNALILSLAEAGLSFLNYRVDALGLPGKAEAVVGAVAQGLDNWLDANRDQFIEHAFSEGMAKRVLETLVTTSLTIASDRPELFSKKDHVQALVGAVAEPLREINAQDATSLLGLGERIERLRGAIRGPVSVRVLETLHERRDDFFAGSFPDRDKAAGVVTEALFASLVADSRELGGVGAVFSEGFLQRTYPVLLDAVSAAPEAFVRGTGAHVALGRDLLTRFAGAISGHRHLEARPDLAGELMRIGVELTREHARAYLVGEARGALADWQAGMTARTLASGGEDEPWSVLGVKIAAHLGEAMIASYARSGPDVGDMLERLDTGLVLDIVGMIADAAAETPGMILPDDVNPEITRIAEGVAAFISSQHAGLLTRADWKRVSAQAVGLAMKNPEALFSLDATDPEDHLAVALVRQVLATAHQGLIDQASGQVGRGAGRLAFGATLAGALSATLEAAVANARSLVRTETIGAVSLFMQRLNALAAARSETGAAGLSADDWLRAFRWYVGQVVATGDGHIPDADLMAIIDGRAPEAAGTAPAVAPAAQPNPTEPPGVPESPEPTGPAIHPVPIEGAEG